MDQSFVILIKENARELTQRYSTNQSLKNELFASFVMFRYRKFIALLWVQDVYLCAFEVFSVSVHV